MIKKGDKNVYEAARERIKVAFDNFDNVLIAFSCGKDSLIDYSIRFDFQLRLYVMGLNSTKVFFLFWDRFL